MADAPRKYHLINEKQLEAARQFWPQVSDKTYVLPLRRSDEPMLLNKPPHKGVGFYEARVPELEALKENMFYRRDIDVLIIIGE
jgi:hypothetical protein